MSLNMGFVNLEPWRSRPGDQLLAVWVLLGHLVELRLVVNHSVGLCLAKY